MGTRFYRSAARLLFLGSVLVAAACSPSAQPPSQAPPSFPPPSRLIPEYPATGERPPLARFVHHLVENTREGLRFAKEILARHGKEAAPLIVAEIRPRISDPAAWAQLVNLCSALGSTGAIDQAGILLEVVRNQPVPVARSAAVDAIKELGARDLVPALVEHARDHEDEPGVQRRILGALGKLGGPDAVDYLQGRVEAWLAGARDLTGEGNRPFETFLGLTDSGALDRLKKLTPRLPPPLALQALSARALLGEKGLEKMFRPFLERSKFPSPGVRSQAVETLAFLGDWEATLSAARSPDARVRLSVAQALSGDGATRADVGRGVLEELAHDQDFSVVSVALKALRKRGDESSLSPWFRLLRGFPFQAGSSTALNLLLDRDLHDPRTTALLLERWSSCGLPEKDDIVRALGALRDPRGLAFLAGVLEDPGEDPQTRLVAIKILPNFAEGAVAPLLHHWDSNPKGADRAATFDSLAALARFSGPRKLLLRLVGDKTAPDADRRLAIDALPNALKEDAWKPLLEARDGARRPEVRNYLNRILDRYF